MAKKVVLFDETLVPEAYPYDGTAILQTEAEFKTEFSISAGSTGVYVKDKGVLENPVPDTGFFTTIDFTGAGVDVTVSGDTAVVDIPGGSGSSGEALAAGLL